jgi:hypothetical protein
VHVQSVDVRGACKENKEFCVQNKAKERKVDRVHVSSARRSKRDRIGGLGLMGEATDTFFEGIKGRCQCNR